MKINGKQVVGEYFAFDGSHKIYICENDENIEEAKEAAYKILPIDLIEDSYKKSDSLKFINNWSLDKTYVGQFKTAKFTEGL